VTHPLAVASNLAGKALRRAAAVPKRGLRLLRRARRIGDQVAIHREEWQIEREIAALARGTGPLVAGPWLSEVGFEVLYWIPFLRWFEARYGIDRDRVVAVSRGGVADWYRDVAGGYVEIFDRLDPSEFARRNAERRERDESGGQKQMGYTALDRELVDAAVTQRGLSGAAVCHPSLMYRLFNQFWFGNRALDVVTEHTRHACVAAAAAPDLPARYIAAKFYTGAALPDTPECRAGIRELVRAAAGRAPVVMLDTGITVDEHEDYLFAGIPNVVSVRDRLTPQDNLGLQTSIIAGADAFIGTCGSLAWLAPLLGVNTIGVYASDRFLLSHLVVADRVYPQVGAASFDTLDVRAALDLDLLHVGT
jgi:hypothetical protein